jgi:hypothetical protein
MHLLRTYVATIAIGCVLGIGASVGVAAGSAATSCKTVAYLRHGTRLVWRKKTRRVHGQLRVVTREVDGRREVVWGRVRVRYTKVEHKQVCSTTTNVTTTTTTATTPATTPGATTTPVTTISPYTTTTTEQVSFDDVTYDTGGDLLVTPTVLDQNGSTVPDQQLQISMTDEQTGASAQATGSGALKLELFFGVAPGFDVDIGGNYSVTNEVIQPINSGDRLEVTTQYVGSSGYNGSVSQTAQITVG